MDTWITKEGKELKVKDMETSHIENCIRFLKGKIERGETEGVIGDVSGVWGEPWAEEYDRTPELEGYITMFEKELKRRSESLTGRI